MKPASEINVVQFSYRAQPDCILVQMADQHGPLSSPSDMSGLTCTALMSDGPGCNLIVLDRTGALVSLARSEAAYRPRIHPLRPATLHRSGSRARTAAQATVVRPTHPAHLVMVSTRRTRPARLSACLPIDATIIAARAALYAEPPQEPTTHQGLRSVAHLVAFIGIFTSLAETAAAQQVLSLF